MNRYLGLIALITGITLAACHEDAETYLAASSLSASGFALEPAAAVLEQGEEAKIWGYVDPANIYGDEAVKRMLGEWWSGYGPDATTWRFNLKARIDDRAGESFPVHIPNDPDRDAVLAAFLADAAAGRPTRVYLRGRVFLFNAPLNIASRTGLRMELQSASDIHFQVPGE